MIVIGSFIFPSGYSQDSKIVLEKNLRIEMTSEIQVNTMFEIAGTSIENSSYRTQNQLIEVTNKQNDVFDISIAVKRLVVKLLSKNGEMIFDSEKKDNPLILAETYDKDAKVSYMARVNSMGYIIKHDTLSANSVLMIDPITSNAIAGSIPVVHTTLLNKNLKHGDKWTDSISGIIAGMKSDIGGVHTVKEKGDSQTVIEFTGIQKISGITKQAGQEISISGNCKVNAEMTLEMKTGLIVNLNAVYEGIFNMDTGSSLIPVTIKTINQMKAKLL